MATHDTKRQDDVTRPLGEAGSPSVAVALAVEELSDTDPCDLEWSLYDYLDPDALDSLVDRGERCGLEIEFSVGNYDVRLVAGERLSVSERTADG